MNMSGALAMSDDPEELRGFTSWKLEILNAMSVDPQVTDLEFRVAFRIMQHVNSVSRLAWPSVARLGAQLDKSGDRIRAATKNLHKLGWLRKGRKSQKAPNEYTFLEGRMNIALDGMLARIEAIGTVHDHADMHGQTSADHADSRVHDHADMHGPDHADMHGKHLKQNYLKGTPSLSQGSERGKVSTPPSGPSYGDVTKGDELIPFDAPESEDEAADMVMSWLEGQPPRVVLHLFDVIRDRLASGELTPAELQTLIGRAAA